VLEADQQEGREAGQLPEDEQRQDVVAERHAEHRAHEGEERRVEAASLRMIVQVLAGVEDDERADQRDQQREQQPQPVEVEGQRQAERRRPRPLDQAAARGQRRPKLCSEDDGDENGPGGKEPCGPGYTPHEPRRERRGEEGRQDDGRDH
jgi:hypothetical protein